MQSIEWMNTAALNTSEWMKMRGFDKPFQLDEFACVTDGRYMVGIKSPSTFGDAPLGLGRDKLKAYLLTDVAGQHYDLEHLKAFCNRPDPECSKCEGRKRISCPECDGTGQVDCECKCGDTHEAPCDECEETGKVECECVVGEIPTLIFGKVVNIIALNRAIKHLHGTYQVGGDAGEKTALVIGGEGWRVALMPMTVKPKETYEPQPAETVMARQGPVTS